ncbi:hypothetical protein PAUR_b0397 [Pseudoalteromonas aurantia 208]|uniref:Uncharacterized protein n=1 Tax=Pseudoalteromonas aurantia 208 TaxID=1314867 RepID=A0ABR9EHG3_9GAMM|nr:hypothetical protein [Pseudoalteromonas aurantia 208]
MAFSLLTKHWISFYLVFNDEVLSPFDYLKAIGIPRMKK